MFYATSVSSHHKNSRKGTSKHTPSSLCALSVSSHHKILESINLPNMHFSYLCAPSLLNHQKIPANSKANAREAPIDGRNIRSKTAQTLLGLHQRCCVAPLSESDICKNLSVTSNAHPDSPLTTL
jgi:hypothetical protein